MLSEGHLIEQGTVIEIFTEPKKEETKSLTQKSLHLELPNYLKERMQASYSTGLSPIVRLAYVGASANEPVIAHLQKQFNVAVSILQADLESIHDSVIGFTVCQLVGEQDACSKSIQYLVESGIKVEVVGYV